MSEDQKTQPLRDWNNIARENIENAIVSSMFEASLNASEPIETFSSWLLVATAAVASFLIANAEKLIPFISKIGFITCGVLLCASCIFGLLSKIFSVRCKVVIEIGAAVRKTFIEHLENYKIEEEKIQKGANFWGIELDSDIRMDRVIKEFLSLFPKWVQWFAHRKISKIASNPQATYITQISTLRTQATTAFIQALCFLGFLGAGFIFAAAI